MMLLFLIIVLAILVSAVLLRGADAVVHNSRGQFTAKNLLIIAAIAAVLHVIFGAPLY